MLLKSKFWLKQDKTNYRDALECREVSSTGTTTGHLQGLLLHYLQNIVTTLVQRLLQRCMQRLTWNMCSMSWWICLKEGRLPSSQCQHSRMRLYTRAGQPGGHSMRYPDSSNWNKDVLGLPQIGSSDLMTSAKKVFNYGGARFGALILMISVGSSPGVKVESQW